MAKVPDDFNSPQNYDSTPPRQKIYNSAASDDELNQNDVVLFPPRPTKQLKRRRIPRRRRKTFPNFRLSTSSDSGLFSDESEETETLISTSASADRHRYIAENTTSSALGTAVPARLSEFMRKMLPSKAEEEEVVEGKVRESYAVVKRSEDPYKDFRRSMAEMVMEKEMFERKDLEELLRCFLELNSEHLHGVIVRAFVDIWVALFVRTPLSTKQGGDLTVDNL